MQGIPLSEILESIRDAPCDARKSLIRRKDLNNIARAAGATKVQVTALKDDGQRLLSQIQMKLQACSSPNALKSCVTLLKQVDTFLDFVLSNSLNTNIFCADSGSSELVDVRQAKLTNFIPVKLERQEEKENNNTDRNGKCKDEPNSVSVVVMSVKEEDEDLPDLLEISIT